MNFCTLSNFNFEAPDIFNLYRDDKQQGKFFLIGRETRIFEVKYVPESFNGVYLKLQFLQAPKTQPTKKLIESSNMITVYSQANILNRQTIGIDPLFASKFSEANIEPTIQHICWPKKYIYNKDIIVVITNFGQCEIIEYNNITRTYEKPILSLNDLFSDIFSTKVTSNFDSLKKAIEDNVVTTCCWLENEKMLMLSTISGWILIVEIDETYKAKLISQIKTDFYKINKLKSFYYIDDKNEICNCVIISNINGLISLYKLENNTLGNAFIKLWNKEDKMSCKQFEIYYDKDNAELFISTIKGFHFLLFIVSTKTWSIIYKGSEFCKAQIANFEKISKTTYIVSTLIGQIKYITLSKTNEAYSFQTEDISHDLEIDNYTIGGMVASENKIAFMFILSPDKNYMLNRQKHASSFSYCTSNAFNPLEILKKYDRKDGDSRKYVDCYEVMRLKITQRLTENNYYLYDFKPILIDLNFIQRLRIRYNIVYSIIGYNMKKTKNCSEIYENELNYIRLSIKALYAYWKLKRINKDSEKLTEFQKLSAKCLNRMLKNYLNNKNLINTPYNGIREMLTKLSKEVIEQFEELCKDITEICNFCNNNTDLENEICLHDVGRCCLSDVQINHLEMKYCEGCGDISLNDEELLKQVMLSEDDMRCPICDYYLCN